MEIENHVGSPLNEEEMKIQTCVAQDDLGHQQPKDYSTYLNFITVYMLVLSCLFLLCFSTEMKRTNADDVSKDRSKMGLKDPESGSEENEILVQQQASAMTHSSTETHDTEA